MQARTEVVVVGGGIVGLAVAHELLRRGRQVVVLECGDSTGVATRAAAGMLAPVSEAEVEDPELLALALDSLERYPAFVAALESLTGLSCGYRTDGTLWVAVTRDDEAELAHLQETLELKKLASRSLTPREVLDLEPHLCGGVLAGVLVERDLQVDPRALAAALEVALSRLGGRVEKGVRVDEILTESGRVRGVREAGPDGVHRERNCRGVVLAAGAWSTGHILSPLSHLGVRPVKGQLLRLRGPRLLRHVVRHPEVYLVPREQGELLVGATMEEMGFDASATAGAVYDLLRRGWRLLPSLYDMELVEVSVGFRPAARDNRPVIGATATEGLFAAFGHGRSGILLAPATAHYLAEEIAGGRKPRALTPFGADRFQVADVMKPV